MLNNFWYACEFSHAVTNQPKQIELWEQKIVLYRNSTGEVVALQDTCPHRGAALSLGKVEQDCLRCPYHGWQFKADGTCIEIPANPPDALIPDKAKVKTYPIKEKYGMVWLFWGYLSPEESPPLPTLSDFPDSSWRSVYVELKINAHYTRLLENLTDAVHTAFIHANSFGSGMNQEPQMLARGKLLLEDWSGSLLLIAKQPAKKGLYWKYIYNKQEEIVELKLAFCLPNLALQTINFKFGISQYFYLVPIDENTTLVKLIHFRNFLTYSWADGLFRKMNLKAIKEDRPIVESQIPQAVPTDLATELNVAGDGLSVAYRKLLKKYSKQD